MSTTETFSAETPGSIIKACREKLELSAADVARQVHLDVNIIETLEADSQEGLPSAIYVRGYLRSIAKVVGADADLLIQLYDSDSPAPLPEILPEVKPPTQVSSSDKPVKAFTYLLTLALVLLLLIWYQSNFVVELPDDLGLGKTNNENEINGVDITYTVIEHPAGWRFPTQTEQTTEEEAANDSLQLQTDGGEQSLGILPIEENTDNVELTTNGQGPDSIEIKLERDSWVEIYDTNKQRLFHDLALAGEQHMIKGTAPFTVLLGFSSGVTVKFNGEPFDPQPYSNNGIARFTLPIQ